MKQQGNHHRRFWQLWSSDRMTRVFVISLIIAGSLLYLISFWGRAQKPDFFSFLETLSMEFIGSAITFWLLEQLIDRKREEEKEMAARSLEQKELITEMSAGNNDTAINAANKLRERGWLTDGTLRGSVLILSNLMGANLIAADLQEADLRGSKLQTAILRDAKLQGANLRGAELQGADLDGTEFDRYTILPDGTLYTKNADIVKFTKCK